MTNPQSGDHQVMVFDLFRENVGSTFTAREMAVKLGLTTEQVSKALTGIRRAMARHSGAFPGFLMNPTGRTWRYETDIPGGFSSNTPPEGIDDIPEVMLLEMVGRMRDGSPIGKDEQGQLWHLERL